MWKDEFQKVMAEEGEFLIWTTGLTLVVVFLLLMKKHFKKKPAPKPKVDPATVFTLPPKPLTTSVQDHARLYGVENASAD